MDQSELSRLIFGVDPAPSIVAVEATEDEAIVYRREGGGLVVEREKLRPWLVSERKTDLPGAEWSALAGEGYSFLAVFSRWSEYRAARQTLITEGVGHFSYGDPVRHYLMRAGRTLFKGMEFGGLARLQLDIETTALSPDDPDARILIASLADSSGWTEVVEGDEPHLLQRVSELIRDRDPDVIEGHNVFAFDLPFIAVRARVLDVGLDWGRDRSALRFGPRRRCAIGGRSRPFVPAYVHGRHIVDTLFAVQRFDAQAGELESYGLKEASEQLGLSVPDRIILARDEIEKTRRSQPERVREYARQDALETARLAEHVTPTDFYLTQMVPDSYQHVAVTGTGEKVNALLVRQYLRRGMALPRPQPGRSFPGGYVEARRVGVISPVVKVDVESLYPSIMLTERIAPRTDALESFLPMLGELTRRRLDAKERARRATGSEHIRWQGIQSSFKVLINSFYGYLGSGFLFNDFDAAERVTRRGQALVQRIAELIENTGGRVVEIDTDGVFFEPPEAVRGEPAERAYVEEIGGQLPKGINLQHDGRYRAMVSLKVKNYVCVGYDGRKLFRGAAVRSRADEPFGRDFLAEAVDLMVAGDLEALSQRYRELSAELLAGKVPAERLARRERVTEKTFSSPAKRRSAAVAGDAAVGDYIRVYQREDGSLARLRDYDGDEDRAYYADKLYRFAVRLREAVGPGFERLFPRPSADLMRRATAGQKSLGFD